MYVSFSYFIVFYLFCNKFFVKQGLPYYLLTDTTEQIAGEGEEFEYDIEESQGFPIVPDTVSWYFNGILITRGSPNPNISVYPFIHFTNVSRTDSGNYSIFITSKGGDTCGFFVLDVQCKFI